MKAKLFFLGLASAGIMLLNNTATAHADWADHAEWSAGGAAINNYSGQIVLGSVDEHDLSDFRRISGATEGSSDSLFGSTSIQSPITLVAGAAIEIEIMTAGVTVNNFHVNGKACPTGKTFNAFVSPVATCSSHFGTNFSGFRAQAKKATDGNSWKPMLYMNVKGRWVDLSDGNTNSGLIIEGAASTAEQCAQVLVQKICQ